MKNITYENQGNSTYLVYEINPIDIVDNISLGMLNNNKIIGLAPVIYSQIDDKRYLKYNISAKVSASTFLAGAASRNRILGIFSGVSKALLSAEEYMLDANTIMLDLDYIYVDVTTCEAELICLPIQRGNSNDVVSFFKNIIFSVTYDQTENCDYVAKIIGCLNSHSSFSLQNFMQTINELNGKRINLQNLQNSQQIEPQPNYTEILHGESQEIKSAAENLQKTNLQTSPMQPLSGQNIKTQPVSYPYGEQVNMLSIPTGNVYPHTPAKNPSYFPPEHPSDNKVISGYQPAREDKMPIANQKPPKKQKTDKKNKKGQTPPPVNYTVPGAPSDRRTVPVQQNIPSGKMEKQQKKGGGLSGLFRKKNKTENTNTLPNDIRRPQIVPNRMGNSPNDMNRNQQIPSNGIANMPNGISRNQPMPNKTGNMANNVNQIPSNQQMPNRMGNMENNINQIPSNPQMPNGMGQISPNQQNIQPQSMENPTYPYVGQSMNFGDTTVLDGNMANGETSVLSAPAATQPYLLRKKNKEKVFITSELFRIGKEANYVDYFIGDNSAISRSHANIISSGKEYYIVDTNSKNHTYVNGQMIQSNMEALLTHGSVVRLANEEFEFRMY